MNNQDINIKFGCVYLTIKPFSVNLSIMYDVQISVSYRGNPRINSGIK